MVSELILKYMTQGGRGLYRFANLSKKTVEYKCTQDVHSALLFCSSNEC